MTCWHLSPVRLFKYLKISVLLQFFFTSKFYFEIHRTNVNKKKHRSTVQIDTNETIRVFRGKNQFHVVNHFLNKHCHS